MDGLWAENRATIAGTRFHRRVDSPGGRAERGRVVVRAVPLFSEQYGLSGRSDGIEIHSDGSVAPVEHKAGIRHGQAANVQLCAQALCLEEMFDRHVPVGWVWYGGTRRREQVEIDADLRATTVSVIDEVRSNMVGGVLPLPVNDERCGACQLEPACLPQVVFHRGAVGRYVEREVLGCE